MDVITVRYHVQRTDRRPCGSRWTSLISRYLTLNARYIPGKLSAHVLPGVAEAAVQIPALPEWYRAAVVEGCIRR